MKVTKPIETRESVREKRAQEYPGVKQQQEADARLVAAKNIPPEELSALRQEEDEHKRLLIEMEKENFTRIYVFKCYNGWLKVCDNSAIILAKKMHGKLGRTYEMKGDTGYGPKARYGAVSVHPSTVGILVSSLAKVGVMLKREDEWLMDFEYGERVSQEEMVRLQCEDELLIEKMNSLVMPKVMFPDVRACVKVLLNYIHVQTQGQRESTKTVIMNDVERLMIDTNRLIVMTARGRVGVEKCLDELGGMMEEMYSYAVTMNDLCLISPKQYKECVDLIRQVEMARAREMKKMALAEAEARIKKKGTGSGNSTIAGRGRAGAIQHSAKYSKKFGGGNETAEKEETK